MAVAKLFVFALACTSVLALDKVPEFILDLDKPPESRWNGAVQQIVDLHGWDNSFGPVIDLYLPLFLLFPSVIGTDLGATLQANYPDIYGELNGIGSQLAAQGCQLCNGSIMYAFAYFYELAHVGSLRDKMPPGLFKSCTGILSLPADPTLDTIHGRNMDENPHPGRNLTLNIHVMKGGKLQYQMIDWTWITAGIATTSRMGGVTLEMNWNKDGGYLPLTEIMARLMDKKTIPVLQSFRVINDAKMDFDQAVEFISTSQFGAPFYNIVSGTKRRGAVLTIEFNASANVVEHLTDSSNSTYMVQTNYDRWKPDPPTDPRRTVAEQTLAMLGRNRSGTELGVWMAISTYPVHNPQTLFTALMSVSKPPEVYIREAMSPTWYL